MGNKSDKYLYVSTGSYVNQTVLRTQSLLP